MENANKSILIVDDDTFLLEMYTIKFKEKGFEVHTATASADALNMLKEGLNPSVITIDIVMPSMTGLELLQTIREEKLAPNSKIIMLTNQNHPQDTERADSLGADGYITKASTIPSEVFTKVNAILSS